MLEISRSDILKSNNDFSLLLDPLFVHVGDVVILTGQQFYGGEHAPQIFGYNGSGFRVYRHELSEPNEFNNALFLLVPIPGISSRGLNIIALFLFNL